MRSAELLVYGVEESLGRKLAAWALDHGLWHRPVGSTSALINLIRNGSEGTIVLRLGRDLVAELESLRAANDSHLTAIVVADADYPALEGIAYDLGADAVVFPPDGVEQIFEMLIRIQDL